MKWRYRGRRRSINPNASNRSKAISAGPRDGRVKNLYDWCEKENWLEGNSADPWEVDHIRPLTRGGKHEYANLRIIRRSANKAWDEKSRPEAQIEIALLINKHYQDSLK